MKSITLLGALLVFIPNAMSQSSLIVAHRGYSHVAPENSLTAFEAAIAVGAPYFELDVQKSADGTPIVIHDETLERTASSNAIGLIQSLSDEELQTVRIGYPERFGRAFENEPLPTLSDALQLAQGRIRVCVEIKVAGIESAIVADIQKWKMDEDVVIFSFLPEVLTQIHSIAPHLKLLFLKSDATSDDLNHCLDIGAAAIGVGGKTKLDEAFINEAAAMDLEVWRWTVDDVAEMRRLQNLGVHAIITNRPDLGMTFSIE